ncbi:60S ribosomal protein L14 [Ctenocephalides felis]|uniref:Large ribosomal subunit protein eL14 n=1 Tax=Ctenocephalides felis TaxID=7515 RepID=I3VPF4_CTEFE|nr:60S ribosomal protein L14 [Ctenocephalides felis]
MVFQRFVETGRVALISDGPNKGKLISIVDVIDQTRVLVDGPCSGVPRQALRINQLHLTKFNIKFPYLGSTRVVRKAWTDAKVDEKWAESMWARKLAAKQARANMGDFDRFKLRKARQRRNRLRTVAFNCLRKTAARNGSLFGKGTATKGGDKPKPKKVVKK